jgi:GAF domain-containing protein/anti-sigma regulatory factor (Ser/Thr protein kinase)
VERGNAPDPQASLERLTKLEQITEAALAHLDFEELVAELLRRLSGILETDTAAVLLLDEETGELHARAALGLEEEVEQRVRIPVGAGFAGRVAAERRPIAVDDVDTFDIFNPILREKGLRSLLGAPLLVEGRVIGVVHVGSLVQRKFTIDDSELLQLAADRLALAIDHARLYETERRAREHAERAAEQLRRLESITEAALAHLSLDELLEVLLVRLRDMTGGDTVAVMMLDEDSKELATRAALGLDEWLASNPRMHLGEGFSGQIASTAQPAALEDAQAAPPGTTAFQASGIRGLLGAPLVVSGTVTGVLTIGTWEPRAFPAEDRDLLTRAADRMAIAIEHARLFDAERAARAAAELAAERIRRIESITEVALHHISLDEDVLERLLSRVRWVLDADTAALYVSDSATQVLVARDPGSGREIVERDIELPPGGGFAGLVARRGEAVVVPDASEVEVVSPMLHDIEVRSLLGVPLRVQQGLLGVLHIGSRERREFGAEELALLELAGERLAVALDRSRMYEREHYVAETLQRSLLPERMPDIPGAKVASRYLPGEGEAVGGDWYDVIPMRDGRVALAMGDVVSRGVRAASVMGQLRNALRAYALEGYEPVAILQRLDTVARGMEGREMATLVYAVFDPAAGTLLYATAGHPPPVVAALGGEVTLLEEGAGPPLGAVPDAVFTAAVAQIPAGGTLLLYTDGIVERRDMWIDEGIERLMRAASRAPGSDPETLLEELATSLLGDEGATDDVAMLALQTRAPGSGPLSLKLPADPSILTSMRQTLRHWLADAGAGRDEEYDVLVATTEAAANAVEHAYGPVDATFEVELASAGAGEIVVIVRDHGSWRPPRGHNRGRGTLLMQELMDHFEVATGDSGTEVRMRKRLTGALAA